MELHPDLPRPTGHLRAILGWMRLATLVPVISLILVGFGPQLGCRSQARTTGPLHTVEEVGNLSPSRLREGLAVRLEGIVTYCDERTHQLVLQDGSGGIAVKLTAPLVGIRASDRIAVTGFTAYESFAPMIVKPRLTRLGSAVLPPSLKAEPVRLFGGKLDYRRIEIECEVIAVTVGSGYFELQARSEERIFRVVGYFVSKVPLYKLPRSRVRLQGVPITTYNPAGEVYCLNLYSCDSGDLRPLSLLPGDPADPAPTRPPGSALTTVLAIKSMANQEAGKGFPIHVQGTVTYWDPKRDNLFLEDATGGIYVRTPEQSVPGLQCGCRLEVEGSTAAGNFAPIIAPSHWRVLGRSAMPAAIKVHPSDGFSARNENRWVELEGVIRRVRPEVFAEARLALVGGQTPFEVTIMEPPPLEELEKLVDSRVKVQGVYTPIYNGEQKLLGFQLHTPSLQWLQVLDRDGGDGISSPARRIHSLLEYTPEGIPQHRVKVEGLITYLDSNGSLFLADGSGGIRLEGVAFEGLHVGDPVQALGFLYWSRGNAVLQDALLRPARDLPRVAPTAMAADAALSGLHDGRLIQVEGFLREQTLSFGDRILTLESGRTTFTAVLEHPQAFALSDRLRAGTLVRLTGVCDIRWDETYTPPNPERMRLLLRTPADITILRDGPWWTLARALAFMVILVIVLLLVAAWLVVLQRQVRARTEQLRRQMQQREALEEQLRQAQKLEGVGRLAGGVAHDFNNLLTVISGYCELLIMELAEGSDLHDCAQEIRKAAERAAGLTRQLLAFSRKQILQPVVLDLNDLVADMDQMLRRLINEDIELITRTCAETCPIKVDPGQISQVLMNLVVNARDAMPGGGKVILETSRVLLEGSRLKLRPDVAPGPYVQMTVTDTGLGMDAETLNQIFEPFFTTKSLGKGTGLGLSTVFGIVKQSGGHIWTYSEPGHGTTFKLFFPIVQEPLAPSEAPLEASSRGGGETVLVVEDQADVRKMVCKALESSGYHILTSLHVEEALAIARNYTGPIHLLLTDIVMPNMNGKDLALRILELRPGIRVLYMSGYTENVVVNQGILESGIAFLQKPFSTRDLVARVIETLQ